MIDCRHRKDRVIPGDRHSAWRVLCQAACGLATIASLFGAATETLIDQVSPPLNSIAEFLENARAWGEERRVRVEGTVTCSLSDRTYFIQDGEAGIYVVDRPATPVQVGQRVEVVGYPSLGGVNPMMHRCHTTVRGTGSPVPVRELTYAAAAASAPDMRVIRLQGRLQREQPRGRNNWLISAEGTNAFVASLDGVRDPGPVIGLQPGSLLELTGVCSVKFAENRRPLHFTLFLRSMGDVRVLAGPPWWTPERRLGAALVAVAGLTLSLVWGWSLRRNVRRMTAKLNAQLAETGALERRYRILFDANPRPKWVCARATLRFLAVNDASVRQYGYSREEFLTLTIHDLQPDFELAALEGEPALANQATPVPVSGRHRRKDGSWIDVEIAGGRLEFDGQDAVVIHVHDVTARLRAEAELRDSERYLRTIIEAEPECVKVLAPDGRLKDMNAAGLRMLEVVSLEEAQAGALTRFVLPKYHEAFARLHERVMAGNRETLVFEIEGLRGSHRWLETLAVPLPGPHGAVAAVLGITRDITAQREAEMTLQASRANLAAAQKIAALGSWELQLTEGSRPDRLPLIWSEEVFRIFGHAPGSIEVSSENFFRAVHPEDRDRVERAVREAIAERKPYRVEHRIVRPDGTIRVVEELSEVVCDPQTGQPERMFGVVQDITERREAERERQAFELKLQQAQKLESLGVLAGGIAHDFNNLLTAVMGNVSLALLELNPVSPAREPLLEAEKATQRAADLARQMLAYSGKGRFVIQRVYLAEVVGEMTQMLNVSVSKKAVLRFNHAAQVPAVELDVTQLRQIILNLVINASDAIGDRSGVIAISTGVMSCDEAYLATTWLGEEVPAGLYSYLEVADSGCGIPKEQLAKIFDPFFTTKFTGRGLGLAAVLGIVRGHHGALKVYSEVGRGTTFKVLFPVPADAGAVPSLAEEPVARWQGHGHILLVDDEESIRAIAQRLLERLGFQVLTASDGREAVEVVREQGDRLTCVLLDLTMPHMDGEETFREIRRLRVDLPVVLSSGYSEQDVVQRFSGKGLAGFVPKPFSLPSLQTALMKALKVKPEAQAA